MQVDKITLLDIGLFDTEGNNGLITHLNFCKTNGGKEKLDQFILSPLASIGSIELRQNAIAQFIEALDFIRSMNITNGSTLVIEKFFETSFKSIPAQISLPRAYWYRYMQASDYSLLSYSLEHLIVFYKNLLAWVAVFETKKDNKTIQDLVQTIKKYTSHPSLAQLPKKSKVENPQELLSLCSFFFYQYKNNTRHLLNSFYELISICFSKLVR
jgi:DNA mismatch repair protein MutS